jgi:hypothetical protein
MKIANGALSFATATLGASRNSYAHKVEGWKGISLHAHIAGGGSPVGTLQLQISNDEGTDPGSGDADLVVTNWVNKGSSVAVSDDGDFLIEADPLNARFARVVYTRTSGSASSSVAVRYEKTAPKP